MHDSKTKCTEYFNILTEKHSCNELKNNVMKKSKCIFKTYFVTPIFPVFTQFESLSRL